MIPYDKREGKIWYNNELLDWNDVKLHVLSHGLHYASTVLSIQHAAAPASRGGGYATGASHQPDPAPDARSDERASEEAASTWVGLFIVNLWGVLGATLGQLWRHLG